MSDIWDATTRSRHNIPLAETQYMEAQANRGMVYETDEDYIRLNFTIHNPDDPKSVYACFYFKGVHFRWICFDADELPPANDDTEANEIEEEPLSAA